MLTKTLLWAAVATAMPLVEMSPRELHELEVHQPVSTRKNPPLEARANRIIPVVVGGAQDTFVPNMIRAAAGDVIQFQFSSGNHTVTQSSEDSPCQPLQATQAGVIHSGHIPFQAGQTTVGTFNVPLNNTEPIYLYCATGPHCQIGQVMAINPPSEENLVQFSKKAAGALANVDAGAATGGTVGEIPLAEAAFTPAEEEAPPAPPAESPPAASSAASSAAPSAPAPPAETPSSTPGAAAMEAHHRLGY
ncbi:Extracellular serine-rich protein [Fusarium oxysporum f. sp. cubense]|uniref:Extracellular serine-rich protein n=1 Tax=Fusarium oxysporum f. sp. cubense TaxID=61366 RepID=A0A559LXU9_FUSOC|nr:Extracellular serine-rich protein [Fusarium oxysporum f. sp. cubense]